ncbi:MAG: hypothetical protein IPM29_11880 [Planctomycetes bacterium]|nr:hypothetical protein [Planctomycetota bacterium]
MNDPRCRPGAVLGLLLALAATAPTPAQSLLGLDDGSLAATGSLVHEFLPDCTPRGRCPTQGVFGSSIRSPYGGIAYDWLDRTVWATDGFTLAQLDLQCNVLQRCRIPNSANSIWTGLAIDPVARMLYYTTNGNDILMTPAVCPLGRSVPVCSFGPALLTLTGIEIDPWDGTLWVCDDMARVFNITGANPSGGCQIRLQFTARCPNGNLTPPVQGITVDRGKREIYLTDSANGLITVDLNGRPLHCCTLPSPSLGVHLVGLARLPEPMRYRGTGCSAAPCPNCTPALTGTSDPHLPNPLFEMRVTDGPVGGAAYFLFAAGGGNVSTPLLCGPIWVDLVPPPIALGPYGLFSTGGGPCSGTVTVPVPIPNDPALYGGVIHSQVFGLCITATRVGHFMTNGAVIQLN